MKNLNRLMRYAGKYKWLTYLSLFVSFISGLITLIPLVFIFFIIRDLLNSNYEKLIFYGWMAFAFAIMGILVYFAALMCSHISAFNTASNIRKSLLEHLSAIPVGEVDRIGSGKIRQTIMEASNNTETFLAHQLPDLAQSLLIPICLIALMFIFDWRLGVASLAPFVISFILMFPEFGPKMKDDMIAYKDALDNMANEAVEYTRGIPVVKAFGASVFSFKRFSKSISKYSNFCLSYTKKARWPRIFFYGFF